MADEERTLPYLKQTVSKIYQTIKETELAVSKEFGLTPFLPDQIHFIHSEELLARYRTWMPKAVSAPSRKELGAVFLIGIGGKLSHGESHDVRAPDYDDWTTENSDGYKGLNGDILVWNPVLQDAFELSSMGIRVDPSPARQLDLTGQQVRMGWSWHWHKCAHARSVTVMLLLSAAISAAGSGRESLSGDVLLQHRSHQNARCDQNRMIPGRTGYRKSVFQNHLHHLIRQPRNQHHHCGVSSRFAASVSDRMPVCSAFKTLKQKAGHLLDAVRAEKS